MTGDILKQIRQGYEMTIEDLSRKSGVSAVRISEQEKGRRDFSVDELFKVDKALDNDVIWALADYYRQI